MAAATLRIDDAGCWHPDETHSSHVVPFPGANLEPAARYALSSDPMLELGAHHCVVVLRAVGCRKA